MATFMYRSVIPTSKLFTPFQIADFFWIFSRYKFFVFSKIKKIYKLQVILAKYINFDFKKNQNDL